MDIKLAKSVRMFSAQSVGLLAEVFNVFNFHNYGCFEGGRTNAKFGDPSCIVTDSRYAQLGAQYNF